MEIQKAASCLRNGIRVCVWSACAEWKVVDCTEVVCANCKRCRRAEEWSCIPECLRQRLQVEYLEGQWEFGYSKK